MGIKGSIVQCFNPLNLRRVLNVFKLVNFSIVHFQFFEPFEAFELFVPSIRPNRNWIPGPNN